MNLYRNDFDAPQFAREVAFHDPTKRRADIAEQLAAAEAAWLEASEALEGVAA